MVHLWKKIKKLAKDETVVKLGTFSIILVIAEAQHIAYVLYDSMYLTKFLYFFTMGQIIVTHYYLLFFKTLEKYV